MALVALAGCIGAVERDELAAEVRARGGGVVGEDALAGAAALADALGVDEVRLARLTFEPPLVTYWVPDGEGSVAAWRWDGSTLAGPMPIPPEAADDLVGTFTVADVPALGAVEEVVDAAVRAVGDDGGGATGILVADRGEGLRIVVAVGGEGPGGQVVFHPDGDLDRVEGR